MTHAAGGHHLLGIVNGIEDPIVSHPHAEASLGALDTLDTPRLGILS